MSDVPLWQQIVWVIASMLGAHGIGTQILRWHARRAESKRKLATESIKASTENVKAKVEIAKVNAEDAKGHREHTDKFQKLLLDRVDRQDTKIDELVQQNQRCEDKNNELELKYNELDFGFQNLASEYELLKARYNALDAEHRRLRTEHASTREDYTVLRRHVDNVEKTNRELKERLERAANAR